MTAVTFTWPSVYAANAVDGDRCIPLSSATNAQLSRWASAALAAVFDEAGVDARGWKRLAVESPGIVREERLAPGGTRTWWAQVCVGYPNRRTIGVTFLCEGDDEVANALREAAARLGWGE